MPGLPGFNGEKPEPVTGHYLLGNGYRGFNPVLMRFNSPDSLSPFGEGGVNAYVYCSGDPVNREDSTGHFWGFLKKPLRVLGFKIKSKTPPVSTPKSPISQDGKPYQSSEQTGAPAELNFPTPLPDGSNVRVVPNPPIRLTSQTIMVANEQGRVVARIPITDLEHRLIRLSVSTYPDPPTIMEKSEVIRKLIGHPPYPAGWTFFRPKKDLY